MAFILVDKGFFLLISQKELKPHSLWVVVYYFL